MQQLSRLARTPRAQILGLCALVALVLFWLGLDEPLHRDHAYFVHLGQSIVDGRPIYHHTFYRYPPTGPLVGPDCPVPAPGTRAREIEDRAQSASGFTVEQFARACERFGITLPGARRPLRAPVGDPEIEGGADELGPFIRVAFDLPPGAYATSLVREISKNTHPTMT